MRKSLLTLPVLALALAGCVTESSTVKSETKEAMKTSKPKLCTDMGPQTPRDIANLSGKNLMEFAMAP